MTSEFSGLIRPSIRRPVILNRLFSREVLSMVYATLSFTVPLPAISVVHFPIEMPMG
jgi:hypothetical protein